jgi:meiotically up-regulated gene 157 (Mug157) protein
VGTFREQQRLKNDGPYRFQRLTQMFYDNAPNRGLGNPTRKIGLLHSAFRPSDDACLFPFLIPSNLFAVVSLRQLQHLSVAVFRDQDLADDAARLADQLDAAIANYAIVNHAVHGKIYAFEIDGFGNSLMMDDANAPSLLSLPYLGCCKLEDATYQRTRAFALSKDNPYFIQGVAEGIGSPHVGPDMIWPLSIIMRALTSRDSNEISHCLRMLLDTNAGTGFMHESFDANNPSKYTRAWFAWCNSLFGELVVRLAASHPKILEMS